jgi:hypothetical protein
MGLVVNRPQELNLADILEQLRPDEAAGQRQQVPIYRRPGADRSRFRAAQRRAASRPPWPWKACRCPPPGRAVRHRRRRGPEKSLITLGYAGWEAGQLEAELADNAWLTCPFDPTSCSTCQRAAPGSGRRQPGDQPQPADQPGGARLMALRLMLGFDYGTKQIGVAVGQVITGQARELCT